LGSHDQYTTIVRAKPSQMVLNYPKYNANSLNDIRRTKAESFTAFFFDWKIRNERFGPVPFLRVHDSKIGCL
jgi:hypothetical protein